MSSPSRFQSVIPAPISTLDFPVARSPVDFDLEARPEGTT